ncbi:hypothetical protein [Tenacibaculum finnmarkense]|uniref:hypothetical protein n=1 Tax=Tenacibaculum finnmarkense TaxID=2781243 RepID=UPI001EFBC9DF|nr:hypothetical protein [Tenacibaculum finnmarkense]MCG8226398.1 hypothetical protein [Tenacibaculum finnmarkense genomovar finnmarkense]
MQTTNTRIFLVKNQNSFTKVFCFNHNELIEHLNNSKYLEYIKEFDNIKESFKRVSKKSLKDYLSTTEKGKDFIKNFYLFN